MFVDYYATALQRWLETKIICLKRAGKTPKLKHITYIRNGNKIIQNRY